VIGAGIIAYDAVGTNNGTIHGAVWTNGLLNGALTFNGDGDHVDFGDIDETGFGNENFSIAAWFYTKGKHNYNDDNPYHHFTGEIVSKYNWLNDGRQWFLAQDEQGYIQFYTNPNGIQEYSELLTSSSGGYQHQWMHVAAVRDGETKLLYINGVLDNTGATLGVVTSKNSKVYIGCIKSPQTGLYHCFNGTIDDVRIYNHALSESEIRELIPEPGTFLLLSLRTALVFRKR